MIKAIFDENWKRGKIECVQISTQSIQKGLNELYFTFYFDVKHIQQVKSLKNEVYFAKNELFHQRWDSFSKSKHPPGVDNIQTSFFP